MEDGGESASECRARRPLSPAVHDAYEIHIEFLKQTKGMSPRPRLYGTHQTFWLPQKNNYFIIRGTKTSTYLVVQPKFQHLVTSFSPRSTTRTTDMYAAIISYIKPPFT